MILSAPLAFLISLVGVFIDRAKAFAISGLVLAAIPCGLFLVGILIALAHSL